MLFCNIDLLDEQFQLKRAQFVGVRDGKIAYIGGKEPEEAFGERYDGRRRLLLPGFFNVHSHAPMVLLRGYAENLTLDRWLHEKVFPFEDQLSDEAVYWATQLAIAEMAAGGTVSFSDMYFFSRAMAKAILDSGIKCNLSRSISIFGDQRYEELPAYPEIADLLQTYQGAGGGRLVIDLSPHSEYTTTPAGIDALAAHAQASGARIQVHLSETKQEHEACKARHGMTPAAYFEAHGLLDLPVTAAHCVWLDDEDFDILKRHGVTAASCPSSNLKLASGYANIPKMLETGLNVALGTDGAASNNRLSMMQELYLFSVAYKGFYHDPTLVTPEQALRAATRAGALAQGREDSGLIKVGYKADLCVIDTDTPQFTPNINPVCNLVYAANGSDVKLTMADGEVLYRDGAYTRIDIERVKAEVQRHTDLILQKL